MWNTSGRQSWIESFKIPWQLQFAKLSFSRFIWNNNRTSRNRFHRLLLIATQYTAVEKCILRHNQNDNFFSMPFEVTFATEDNGIYKLLCQTSLPGCIRKQNSFFPCLQFLFSLYFFISMSLLIAMRHPNVCNGRIVLQFDYFNTVLGFALEN